MVGGSDQPLQLVVYLDHLVRGLVDVPVQVPQHPVLQGGFVPEVLVLVVDGLHDALDLLQLLVLVVQHLLLHLDDLLSVFIPSGIILSIKITFDKSPSIQVFILCGAQRVISDNCLDAGEHLLQPALDVLHLLYPLLSLLLV